VAVVAAKKMPGVFAGAAWTNYRADKWHPGCRYSPRSVGAVALRAVTHIIGLDVDAKMAARRRAHRRLLATD